MKTHDRRVEPDGVHELEHAAKVLDVPEELNVQLGNRHVLTSPPFMPGQNGKSKKLIISLRLMRRSDIYMLCTPATPSGSPPSVAVYYTHCPPMPTCCSSTSCRDPLATWLLSSQTTDHRPEEKGEKMRKERGEKKI